MLLQSLPLLGSLLFLTSLLLLSFPPSPDDGFPLCSCCQHLQCAVDPAVTDVLTAFDVLGLSAAVPSLLLMFPTFLASLLLLATLPLLASLVLLAYLMLLTFLLWLMFLLLLYCSTKTKHFRISNWTTSYDYQSDNFLYYRYRIINY
jgi:hypothetical protein